MSLCASPLRGLLGFQLLPFHWDGQKESWLIFTFRYCGNSSSQHKTPQLGSVLWAWDTDLFLGDLVQWGFAPSVQPLSVGLGSAHFLYPLLVPASMWPFYILSYRISVQLVFKWCWSWWFCISNFGVIVGFSRHNVYLPKSPSLTHLNHAFKKDFCTAQHSIMSAFCNLYNHPLIEHLSFRLSI